MTTMDIDVLVFSRLLESLPDHLPISDKFEQADPQKRKLWWSSQREHMGTWFASQPKQTKRGSPNWSARSTYQRLGHPEGMVWIAEALGVSNGLLQSTVDEALTEPNRRIRSGIVRRHLPWSLIFEHAQSRLPK